MVTRAEGAVMRMTYEKYRSRRKVEPGDLDMLAGWPRPQRSSSHT